MRSLLQYHSWSKSCCLNSTTAEGLAIGHFTDGNTVNPDIERHLMSSNAVDTAGGKSYCISTKF